MSIHADSKACVVEGKRVALREHLNGDGITSNLSYQVDVGAAIIHDPSTFVCFPAKGWTGYDRAGETVALSHVPDVVLKFCALVPDRGARVEYSFHLER